MKSLAALIVLVASTVAYGQGANRFEARVSTEQVTLDQSFELQIILEADGRQVLESYRPPTVPDFEVLHQSTQQGQQWNIFNGTQVMRRTEIHQYVLRPRKKGLLVIGPAVVRINGKELQTKPIKILASNPPRNSANPPPPNPGTVTPPQVGAAPESARGDEDLFIDARVDKAKIYVGEQLTATWRIFTRADIIKYRNLSEPKHEDFWSEDLFSPGGHLSWDRTTVKGRDYVVALLMKKALFPLKAGKLTISSLEAEATTLETAFYANASASRKSSPISVEVMPLPADGRPAGFESANVGQFQLQASVDRDKIVAGAAVTWKVTLRGTGNIRQVRLPKLGKVDGWKLYEPTVRENITPGEPMQGEKVYTFIAQPERGGTLALPAIALPYFDPATAKYATTSTNPINVTIEGDPSKVGNAPVAPSADNVLQQQIRPIRNLQSPRQSVASALWRSRYRPWVLSAPPGLWLLILGVDGVSQRLRRETEGSKRRRAKRLAKQRLRVAEYHVKAARPSAFFGECARAIYELLEWRLGQKVEALTLTELRALLEMRGVQSELAEKIVHELESCDFARFAQSASGPGEMRAALRRVKLLLDEIERARAMKEAA